MCKDISLGNMPKNGVSGGVEKGQIKGFKAADKKLKVIKRRNGDSGKGEVSDEPFWEDPNFTKEACEGLN